jgi:hypothetical protein
MADFEQRAYESIRARHITKVRQLAESIRDGAGYVLADLDRGDTFLHGHNIAEDAAELRRRLDVLDALKELKGIYESGAIGAQPVKFCPECGHGASLHASTLNATCTVHNCTCREVFPESSER